MFSNREVRFVFKLGLCMPIPVIINDLQFDYDNDDDDDEYYNNNVVNNGNNYRVGHLNLRHLASP